MATYKPKHFKLNAQQHRAAIKKLIKVHMQNLLDEAVALDSRPIDKVKDMVDKEMYAMENGVASFYAAVDKAVSETVTDAVKAAQARIERLEASVAQRTRACVIRENAIAKAVISQYYRAVDLYGAEKVHVPNEVIAEIRKEIREEFDNKFAALTANLGSAA